MSQDNVKCAKCEKPCGYDDYKGYWEGGNLAICGQCKENLIRHFGAFFGIEGISSDNMGLDIEWKDVDKILSNIKRDYAMRVSYITTDKELWSRKADIPTPIDSDK